MADQAGLIQQIRGFNQVYWLSNVMEMFERLAYYGLRTVLPIYMLLSVEQGGPQFDHVQKGSIYAYWALVQSGLPVFTGGYADRYGYKLTVAVAIAVKVIGYLVMAYALELAALGTNGASAGVPGHLAVYVAFTAGALLLAGGTAIFKPGIQGIIGHQLTEANGAVGWSVFYQVVNVGGFLGPYLAGVMRLMDWKYVFISCALIVSFNYVLLFLFAEPEQEAGAEPASRGLLGALLVLWHSAIGICEPRLMWFLVIFSGFWAMFNQLFDLLPNYIDDWIDGRGVAATLVAPFMTLPEAWNGHLPQEHMINVNAGMCMLFAFLIGYVAGKMRAMSAMIVGILLATGAIGSLGWSMNGWWTLAAIASFSLGELFASPTKMRYFSSIAPPGKKGLYLGYINATVGIGWFLGSLMAGTLYETLGDKVVLARRHLVDVVGLSADSVESMPKDDVVPLLATRLGTDAEGVRVFLMETYAPSQVWTTFAMVGLLSMVGLVLYDQITRRNLVYETALLVPLTFVVARLTYDSWYPATFFVLLMLVYVVIERVLPDILPTGQT